MIREILKRNIAVALKDIYSFDAEPSTVVIDSTREEFEGDYTFVVFPYLKASKQSPEKTAEAVGNHLKENVEEIASFNVIKGFLNLVIAQKYWIDFLQEQYNNSNFGFELEGTGRNILVEYSSPNTNKPLHLGHVRNNLLGYAVAEILKANGHRVSTCNLVNDRGIHICKSMLAWMKNGNGETPQASGIKGDHLVGKYYVEFDKLYKSEIAELVKGGMSVEDAEKKAPSVLEAQELLRKWEAGDEEVVNVWKMMNAWVYEGFDITYRKLGVRFDKTYYESNTYLLGKDIVNEGLVAGVFYKKDDGSVWIDLREDGLDEKLLLRADGTSVYITQDIGTAELKFRDFDCERSIYVVGNEQEYHFKVLQLICSKLGKSYAPGIYHLSYGMVELPEGKMKSREGTVVDADDLIDEMISTAEETTKALGKTGDMDEKELSALYQIIAMGALKYFLLKVDPKKKMMFNPKESIDFHGNTGPFIQYTHARIRSILRNRSTADDGEPILNPGELTLNLFERNLIRLAYQYSSTLEDAGKEMSPGMICNYIYEVAKTFNQFYHECPILKEEDPGQRKLRLMLCTITASVIKSGFGLLGIPVPERM